MGFSLLFCLFKESQMPLFSGQGQGPISSCSSPWGFSSRQTQLPGIVGAAREPCRDTFSCSNRLAVFGLDLGRAAPLGSSTDLITFLILVDIYSTRICSHLHLVGPARPAEPYLLEEQEMTQACSGRYHKPAVTEVESLDLGCVGRTTPSTLTLLASLRAELGVVAS